MSDRDGAPPETTDGESEWTYTLEDIEEREAEAEAAEAASRRRQQPIEAGDPTLEGTAFVLLGAALTLFVLSRLVVG